jgi:5-methylcytosine-specific restriction endonuclease McrA
MNIKKPRRKCKNCNKECNKPAKFYCNNICQSKYKNQFKIQKWLNGDEVGYKANGQTKTFIRNYLIHQENSSCQLCGWDKKNLITNKTTLEVHHKDGNYKNNSIDNLQILCPNCHSLTESYKNLNKGKGREQRRQKLHLFF